MRGFFQSYTGNTIFCIIFSILLWNISPAHYDHRSQAIKDNEHHVFFQLEVFDNAYNAAKLTGLPMVYDTGHGFERLENRVATQGYDATDGLFWAAVSLFGIQPTKTSMYSRNIAVYLLSSWILALSFAHLCLLPALTSLIYAACFLSLYLPPVLRLVIGEYIGLGLATSLSGFMLGLFILLKGLVRLKASRLKGRPLALLGAFSLSVIIGFLAHVHAANMAVIYLTSCILLFFGALSSKASFRHCLGFVLMLTFGVGFSQGLTKATQAYRDAHLDIPFPKYALAEHGTMLSVYNGIGSFPNALHLHYDQLNDDHEVVERTAQALNVPIFAHEKIGGTQIVKEAVYLRLWWAYLSDHPGEYLSNRIQANAWVLSRFAKRFYPDISPAEKTLWQILAVLSWLALTAFFIWSARRKTASGLCHSLVLLLSVYVGLVSFGIIGHPIRGYVSFIPMFQISICLASLGLFTAWVRLEGMGPRAEP